MTEHTPGPWEVVTDFWGDQIRITGPAGVLVSYAAQAAIYGVETYKIEADEAAANARLIAAAPDLLRELQELILVADELPFTTVGHFVEHCSKARAAIAKATGGNHGE
jgi:hypothetical protein